MGSRRPPVWILFWAQLRGDPKKAAVLIVLAVVMAGVYARLFLTKGGPQEVSALEAIVAEVPPTAVADVTTSETTPTEARERLDRPLVRKLSRDPFMFGSDHLVDVSNADGSETYDAFSPDPVQQARAAAAELVLESTICGSMPLASINGRVIRPGEYINGFVLERVGPTRVVLRRHKVRVILTLK